MIIIKEGKCEKLPGLSSLFLQSPYNPKIITIVKGCEVYNYNKKTKIWELPITDLAYLLDNLTTIDDIELEIMKKDKREDKKFSLLSYKIPLLEHQEEGVQFGLNNDKWLLLDAPGLGKTAQVIHIAEELKAKDKIEHCLIICGINALKTNWKREIEKHSDLSAVILGERRNSKGKLEYLSIPKRAEQLKNNIDEFFIITNIESFRSSKQDMIKALETTANKIDMVVVDEIHKCKSSTSIQGKMLLKIDAPYKIALTGTLLLNDPLDSFVPLKWINANQSTLTSFKQYFCTFGEYNQINGFKNIEVLKEMISQNSLRRTKDILGLPPKTIINEVVDMEDDQTKLYNGVINGIKEEIDKIELKTSSLLSLVTRLRQATACPSVLTSKNIESAKVTRAIDLIEEITSNGDKIVVMSNFKETIRVLEDKLKEMNPLVCIGDTKEEDIDKNKQLFQTDDNYKVMLATWQKMGTGHTLNAATYLINIDTAWTYALYEQTCDRIHRIGSDKPVFIYNLICRDTVDEIVMNILEVKKSFSDFIVDDILTDEAVKILQDYIVNL